MRFFRNLFYPFFSFLRSLLRPSRWFELPRRLGRLSPPALAALGTFLLLVICVLAVYLRIWRDADELIGPRSLLWMLLLVALITTAVYYVVYLWSIPAYRTFDDILEAWEKGIRELERHELDLDEVPLFLVLGVENRERIQTLLQASSLQFPIADCPSSQAALHWYAGQEAVFLVSSEVGCLTRVAQQALRGLTLPAREVPQVGPPGFDPSVTCWPTQMPESLDDSSPAESPDRPALSGTRRNAAPIDPGMTLELDDDSLDHPGAPAAKDRLPEALHQRLDLKPDTINEQTDRLEYLCRLIAEARQPRAPINGILALLPLNMILCDRSEGADIQQAASQDLKTCVRALQLRCPSYAVVTGWEDDVGFQELVRRISDHQRHNRFGKGNRTGDPPTPDRLEAVAKNATVRIEDFIYHFFKQPDALTKPGNRKLFMLLCKTRRYFNARLERILAEGFSSDGSEETGELFGGCYFVAAGAEKSRQAFTRGVFQRVLQQEKELVWTSRAQAADVRYRGAAFVAFALALGLLMATVAMIMMH